MRRSNAPHTTGAGNNDTPSNDRASYLERENDDMINGLREKVAAVKTLTVNIGDEIRYHNKLLKGMDTEFETGASILSRAMGRVRIISRSGYHKHFLYLILFAFLVFLIIYIMYKFK